MAVKVKLVNDVNDVPQNEIIEELRFLIENKQKCFSHAILTGGSVHLCKTNGEIEISIGINEIVPISYLIRE